MTDRSEEDQRRCDRAAESGAGDTSPERIGPYRILDTLGEGGMGTVYLAEQREPVRRRVALKVIKLGMDSKQVLLRFEAERQALAMMEHDNIAKVLDCGYHGPGANRTSPWSTFPAEPITEYCDQRRLSTATHDRLRLFQQHLCRRAARPPKGCHPPGPEAGRTSW